MLLLHHGHHSRMVALHAGAAPAAAARQAAVLADTPMELGRMVVAAGVEPALAAFSTPCLCQIGLRDPGMKSGGTRRTCSPSRSERDVFTSDETRRAGPVHVPWCPQRDSHPHWPVFEAGASADWATRAKLTAGAPGRSRTGTGPDLNRPPLPIGLRERS